MKKFYLILLYFILYIEISAQSKVLDYTGGTFILNEDWFGHDNGSLNYLTKEGTVLYKVYRKENNGETFGVTSQYGDIYGDKIYVVSKQAYKTGGRLVVADAITLKKITSIDNIGADGRSFLGVDKETGYIATVKGIYIFDIKNMKVKGLIEGTDEGRFTEVGNMIRTSQFVFAIQEGKRMFVIDPITHSVIKVIEGAFNRVAQSKDGYVWVGSVAKLNKINPYTLEIEDTIMLPEGSKIQGSWAAWNAGSFCASVHENALYWTNDGAWTGGNSVTKFDIDNKVFNVSFFKIPTAGQIFYGAGLRVDPRTDQLIMTVTESGYGSHFEKNWIYIADNKGNLLKTYLLKDYYWFPAMPIFPNYIKPEVVTFFPKKLEIENEKIIDLKKEVEQGSKVVKRLSFIDNKNIIEAKIDENDILRITPLNKGKALLKLEFDLNGQVTEKEIKVLTYSFIDEMPTKIYPNPALDYITVETLQNDKMYIYTNNGVKVFETLIEEGKNKIDLSSLQSGVYMVVINKEKFKIIKK